MKTKLILFLLCILSLSAKGQGIQFSIEAGATINRPKYSFTHSGSFIGVRVGGWAKLHPISTMPGAYTTTGLLLSAKGDKTLAYIKLSEQELYELTSTNKRNYLEIPMRVGYDFVLNDNLKFLRREVLMPHTHYLERQSIVGRMRGKLMLCHPPIFSGKKLLNVLISV